MHPRRCMIGNTPRDREKVSMSAIATAEGSRIIDEGVAVYGLFMRRSGPISEGLYTWYKVRLGSPDTVNMDKPTSALSHHKKLVAESVAFRMIKVLEVRLDMSAFGLGIRDAVLTDAPLQASPVWFLNAAVHCHKDDFLGYWATVVRDASGNEYKCDLNTGCKSLWV